ncbi:aldo/keto reductase [Nonomuraea thailandensis]
MVDVAARGRRPARGGTRARRRDRGVEPAGQRLPDRHGAGARRGRLPAQRPRFSAENLAGNNDRYAPVRTLAANLGITPAQLALAWLLHQDEHVVAIPGSRTPPTSRRTWPPPTSPCTPTRWPGSGRRWPGSR